MFFVVVQVRIFRILFLLQHASLMMMCMNACILIARGVFSLFDVDVLE